MVLSSKQNCEKTCSVRKRQIDGPIIAHSSSNKTPKEEDTTKKNRNRNHNNNNHKNNQRHLEAIDNCCFGKQKSFDRKISKSKTLKSSSSSSANEKVAATASSTATTTTQTKSKNNSNHDMITETTAPNSRARNGHNNNNTTNNNINNNNKNQNNNPGGKNNNNADRKKNSWKPRYRCNRNYELPKTQVPAQQQQQQTQTLPQQYQQQGIYQDEQKKLQLSKENGVVALKNNNINNNNNNNIIKGNNHQLINYNINSNKNKIKADNKDKSVETNKSFISNGNNNVLVKTTTVTTTEITLKPDIPSKSAVSIATTVNLNIPQVNAHIVPVTPVISESQAISNPPIPPTITVNTTIIKDDKPSILGKPQLTSTYTQILPDIVDDKFAAADPASAVYPVEFLHWIGTQITGNQTASRHQTLSSSPYSMDIYYDAMYNTQLTRANSFNNYMNYNGGTNMDNYSVNQFGNFFRETPTSQGMNYSRHAPTSLSNQQRLPYHQYPQMYHQQSPATAKTTTTTSLPMATQAGLKPKDASKNANEMPPLVELQQMHGRINHNNSNYYQLSSLHQTPTSITTTTTNTSTENAQNSQYRNFNYNNNNNNNNNVNDGHDARLGRNLPQNGNPQQTEQRLGEIKSNGSNSSLASTLSQSSGGFRKSQQQQQQQQQQQNQHQVQQQQQQRQGSQGFAQRQGHQHNQFNNNNNNTIYNNSTGNRTNYQQQQQQQQIQGQNHNHHHSHQQQQQQQMGNQNFNNLTYVNTRNDQPCAASAIVESKKNKSETLFKVNAIPPPVVKKDKKDTKNSMAKTSHSYTNGMQEPSGPIYYQENNLNTNKNRNNNNNSNNRAFKSGEKKSARSISASTKSVMEPISLTLPSVSADTILKKYENRNTNSNVIATTSDTHNNIQQNNQVCQTDAMSESELALLLLNANLHRRSRASSVASISPRFDDQQCMHLMSHSSSSSNSSLAEDNMLKYTTFRGRSKRHSSNEMLQQHTNLSVNGSGKKSQHTQTFCTTELQHMLYLRSLSASSLTSHDMFGHTPPDRFLARAHLIECKKPPIGLLTNTKWDNLSQHIWDKFVKSQQTEETFKKKMRLWRDLYILIKSKYTRYGLYLVGSTISGFGADSSDVDMCLVARSSTFMDARTEALINLNDLRDCLMMTGDFECFNLIDAKVPILRFRDCHNKLEVDLNYNNSVGIKNTHLLYCYSQLDWRLRPLVLVVKLWAQYHNINNAKNMTISSYSIVLMVIHYLQYAVNPPVLPCLHAIFPDKFAMWRLNEVGHVDMNESMIGAFESQNKQPLGELFLGFLEYYSKFNYCQSAISIRTGGLLPIQTCRLAKSIKNDMHQWRELCIEEPFDLTNTARSVYDFETFERVKHVFINSWQILSSSLNLNDLFSPNSLLPMIVPSFPRAVNPSMEIVDGGDHVNIDDNIMTNARNESGPVLQSDNSQHESESDVINTTLGPAAPIVNILRWDTNNNHSNSNKNTTIDKTSSSIQTNVNYKKPIT